MKKMPPRKIRKARKPRKESSVTSDSLDRARKGSRSKGGDKSRSSAGSAPR